MDTPLSQINPESPTLVFRELPREIFSLVQEAERNTKIGLRRCISRPTAGEIQTYLSRGWERETPLPASDAFTFDRDSVTTREQTMIVTSDRFTDEQGAANVTVSVARILVDRPEFALLCPNGTYSKSDGRITLVSKLPCYFHSLQAITFSIVDLFTEYYIIVARGTCPIVDYPKKHLVDRYNREFAPRLQNSPTGHRRLLIAYFIAAMLEGREDLLREEVVLDLAQGDAHKSAAEMFQNCVLHIRDEVMRLTGATVSPRDPLALEFILR